LIRFEDLTQDPIAAVTDAVNRVAPDLPRRAEVTLPAFDELQQLDRGFFRRGVVGTHWDEMTAELEELFWSYEDNRDAMERLGYGGSVIRDALDRSSSDNPTSSADRFDTGPTYATPSAFEALPVMESCAFTDAAHRDRADSSLVQNVSMP
jgi:hypothetical protein